ncbi:MAG: hypothetical protein M3H12_09805 [Chromatiales bacterium]|nr:hypothetical protein [Gammaproteobacteria bacterium]
MNYLSFDIDDHDPGILFISGKSIDLPTKAVGILLTNDISIFVLSPPNDAKFTLTFENIIAYDSMGHKIWSVTESSMTPDPFNGLRYDSKLESPIALTWNAKRYRINMNNGELSYIDTGY